MTYQVVRIHILFAVFALMLLSASNASSQEQHYEAMQGVTAAQTAFDFRIGDANVALGHLNLIGSMLTDPAMVIDGEQPEIVVVFIGPSVKLISTAGNASSEAKAKIAKKISAMHADGVRFEICMTAAHAFEVPADSILPEIVQVENGWISLVGYQHKGYALIADF